MSKLGIMTLLGFAQKAKGLAAGEANVEAYLKKGKVSLLLVATDLAENRKKSWAMQAEDYDIKLIEVASKAEMGTAVGMSPRGIIGITDQQMASAILKKMD